MGGRWGVAGPGHPCSQSRARPGPSGLGCGKAPGAQGGRGTCSLAAAQSGTGSRVMRKEEEEEEGDQNATDSGLI